MKIYQNVWWYMNKTREQLLEEFFKLCDIYQVSNWIVMLTESERETIKDVTKEYMDTMMEANKNESITFNIKKDMV